MGFLGNALGFVGNMFGLGGDGGHDDGSAARQIEFERQQRINLSMQKINEIFNQAKQNPGYEAHRQDITDLNARDVERQFTEAERANLFGLARSGLRGGSVDTYSNAELQRRRDEGVLRAKRIGDQALANWQNADDQARHQLISQAQAGIDPAEMARMAHATLATNSRNAMLSNTGANIKGLFDSLANAHLHTKQMQGQRSGYAPFQQWNPSMAHSVRDGDSGRIV
ncbi:MAG: hypothetical protein ON057_001788 [Glomeribacter sp. 1016415]|nr:hypothetical protein [Glomeribacter sp. 1016415]